MGFRAAVCDPVPAHIDRRAVIVLPREAAAQCTNALSQAAVTRQTVSIGFRIDTRGQVRWNNMPAKIVPDGAVCRRV